MSAPSRPAPARSICPTRRQHPAFAYLPETGEEIYNSFLGVPVLRAGRTLGVLVVQNRTKRVYRDDEVEALETTAMVIAEMIATGESGAACTAWARTRPGPPGELQRALPSTMASASATSCCTSRASSSPISSTRISTRKCDRLETSLGSLRLSIDDMLSRRDVAFEGEHREVLEAYRMFANDTRLGAASRRGDSQRPDGGSRG